MLFKSEKARPILGLACALGWSLAYPFIKLGYGELQIASTDLGSKILFAGIRFLMAAFSRRGCWCWPSAVPRKEN